MKAASIIVGALALALGAASPAAAEDVRGAQLGFMVGATFPDVDVAGEDSPATALTGALRAGYVFSRRWTWFADGIYASIDTADALGDAAEWSERTGFELLLRPESRWAWFLNAGAGWLAVDYDAAGQDFDRAFASGAFGQAIRWGTTRRVRWEWRGDFTLGDSGLDGAAAWQGRLLAGLTWGPPAAGAPASESVPSDRDFDGDGVRNHKDDCSETPAGAAVDASGCPLDGDRDGVPDGLDLCPDTRRGTAVDATGCLADSDADGVPDGADACPATPHGARVDEWGCPLDADRDKVPDGLDRCPATPQGAAVDDGGCPSDADGDGVPDGIDRCAGTPAGATVDRVGCSEED